MRRPLSSKHTAIYLVAATWPDAKFEAWTYGSLDEAVARAKTAREQHPEAWVQTHTILQSLPTEV